jgi:hypothetical protein
MTALTCLYLIPTTMAQRLKRKLDNMGVDPSSARATENFCLVCACFFLLLHSHFDALLPGQIGTPLPSLASTKDANEFVPVWKQEVSKLRTSHSWILSTILRHCRSVTKRADDDYMARSPADSQLATLTPLGRRKVRTGPA